VKKRNKEGMRLMLHKETLRMLNTPELRHVDGGAVTVTNCQTTCGGLNNTEIYCCYQN